MIFFLDTNLLVYLLDPQAEEKRRIAGRFFLEKKPDDTLVLSPQSLNECYRVMTDRRGFMPRGEARRFIESLMPYCTAPLDATTLPTAWKIQDEGFSWWDSLLLSSALQAGCTVFYSEDMQNGRSLAGMSIINPFQNGFSQV